MKADSADKLVKISSVIKEIYGDDLHKKRQLSIAYAAMGLLASESLFLHRMAEGLVEARGVNKKHAAKQIDRLSRLLVVTPKDGKSSRFSVTSRMAGLVWDLSKPILNHVNVGSV